MGNKTIYVRDEDLWLEAKRLAGSVGLSKVVADAIARFVQSQRSVEKGFELVTLPGGIQEVEGPFGADHGRAETIQFQGRKIWEAFPHGEPFPLIVYRTKAGKLVLHNHGEELTEVFEKPIGLLDHPDIKALPPSQREELLESVEQELGAPIVRWIE